MQIATALSVLWVIMAVATPSPAQARDQGRILVFSNVSGFRWYSMKPDGSDSRLHSRLEQGDAWSANGRRIARYGKGTTEVVNRRGARRTVVGSAPPVRRLGVKPSGPPQWSPDGRKLVWHRVSDGEYSPQEVAVGNTDGSGERTLYTPVVQRPGVLEWSTWMADSRHIAAVGPPTSLDPPANIFDLAYPCTAGIYRLDSQTGAASLMFEVPGYNVEQGMDFSPDGRRVAYLRQPRVGQPCRVRSPQNELVVADVDGSDTGVVARAGRRWVLHHPSWSPDSRRLVFMRSGTNNKLQVMTVRRDGSQLRNISRGCKSCAGWFPQWIRAR